MTELWLTGPVEGVHPLLQPAAHAFLQVGQDVPAMLSPLNSDALWTRQGSSASIGYHAVHLAGATDRLLTYARGESLSDAQMAAVRAEASAEAIDGETLGQRVAAAMHAAVDQLRRLPPESLTDAREVGRKRLPSTVIGLVFHAAEHAARHAGQIATLCKVIAR